MNTMGAVKILKWEGLMMGTEQNKQSRLSKEGKMFRNTRSFLRKNTWFFPVCGAVVGLIIALLFFKKAYCFYA